MYQIVHGLIDIPGNQFLHPTAITKGGHTLKYTLLYCRTEVYQHSFFLTGICLWNQLPEHVPTAQNMDAFRAGLTTCH